MNKALKYYLAAYNLIAFCFWTLYLICFFAARMTLTPLDLLLLNIAQGLAILDILHALLRWVRSPILSTIAQVASRILVLVLINIFIREAGLVSAIAIGVSVVSIAWGLTEMVRYSLYFLTLVAEPPGWLVWMRYSFFIVLYPAGIIGEWLIITAPIAAHGFSLDAYTVFALLLFPAYAYYFPVLYRYMWAQRKSKVG